MQSSTHAQRHHSIPCPTTHPRVLIDPVRMQTQQLRSRGADPEIFAGKLQIDWQLTEGQGQDSLYLLSIICFPEVARTSTKFALAMRSPTSQELLESSHRALTLQHMSCALSSDNGRDGS